MLFRPGFKVGLCFCAGSFLLSIAMPASAADEEWKEQLELLRQQNAAMQETVREHERLPASSQEIIVPAEGEVTVNFNLGVKNLPKY
ncbi:MAG: hypothetical protein AAB370_00525 [Verrucomicrobiota bacterium]